ncbi:MAG: type 4a pilus biogenesis protein PilO [Bdellovibrionales bacterium]|nr:type 4a pilus biogenesis protein PilO [Bdellovibrionales bacterium]
MIEKINKLSPLMCFLIGLGLAGFTYFNSGEGLERLQSSVVNAQNEWDRQQEEVKSAQAIANDKAKFEEELNYVSDRLKAALEYLPTDLNAQEILSKLYGEASSAGVKLLSVKPGVGQKDKFYEEISLDIQMEGSFSQLTLFLSYISKLKRILRVKDYELSVKEVVDGRPILTMRGVLVAYRYIEQKKTEATAKGENK